MGKRKKLKPVVIKKDNRMRNALIASLIIHALIFAGIGLGSKGGGESNQAKQEGKGPSEVDKEGNILEKPEDKTVEISLVPPLEKSDVPTPPQPEPKEANKTEECTGFGGIGIQYSGRDGTIGQVFKGYPAYKAGIEPGDVIVSPSLKEIKGEPGTKVTVSIIRRGQLYEIELTRELICTDKALKDK
jgi:membrane-associated protease RseP (regulator of RpoE activity)